jgi:polyhydroxyalkanoate synthesis repressor PhaR
MESGPERQARRHRPQEAVDAVGEIGIAGERGHLFLPQIDEPLGKRGQVGLLRCARVAHAPHHSRAPAPEGTSLALFCAAIICYAAQQRGATLMSDTSSAAAKLADKESGKAPVTIKKYANRRLYNTATSSYVTLDDLSKMVKAGNEFVVHDAKTGEDLTRAVLTQIIVEEEQKGQNLLPIGFLRQLISLYGDSMQWLVPRYLDQAMASFAHNQDQMRRSLQDAFGGLFPFGPLEEMGKQNLALFEKTMKMFSPFPGAAGGTGTGDRPRAPADSPASAAADAGTIRDLNNRLDQLQKQLEALTRPGRPDKAE